MASRISCAVALLLATNHVLATKSLLPRNNKGPLAFSLSAETAQGQQINGLSRRNADIPLTNLSTIAYLVTLSIGTPGQKVRVVVDTGSDELWVNPSCNSSTSASSGRAGNGVGSNDQNECLASGRYDPAKSSTSKNLNKHGHIQYAKGKVSFDYYNDTVSQSDSGVTLNGLQFGVARKSEDMSEGILGLGFAENHNYTTFVGAVAQQGAAGGPGKVFSIGLASANQANAGTLVLGGLDTNRFTGPMMGVPILPPPPSDTLVRYWVKLDSIGLTGSTVKSSSEGDGGVVSSGSDTSNKTYANSGGPIVLDTGSTLSILPFVVMEALAKDLGASTMQNSRAEFAKLTGRAPDTTASASIFPVPCSSLGLGSDVHSKENQAGLKRTVDFSFNNGAARIRVPLSEFSIQITDNLCCLGGISLDDGSSSSSSSTGTGIPDPASGVTLLLGATFLRGAYVVYDQTASSVFMAPYATCNGGTANLQALASATAGAAGGFTGACSAADSLVGGGAGGFAAAAASASAKGESDDSKKNAGLRSSNVSTSSLVAVFVPTMLMLLCA
ncbi:hypothetical protein Sste5346_004746 [Sporothrix stenoceras]|uniref:Peptidase A1 domain-containing protein n=1 Tax=Sporothrix stenoceras TaxID=5173 RepID=A0ABR3Z6U0_9PEZI